MLGSPILYLKGMRILMFSTFWILHTPFHQERCDLGDLSFRLVLVLGLIIFLESQTQSIDPMARPRL